MDENYIYIFLIIGAVAFLTYLWVGQGKRTKVSAQHTAPHVRNDASFSLKMQAYERLTLFLERSKPHSLLMRFLNKTEDVNQLQLLLLQMIREEFEHNFSQQIYVSENLWQTISLAKDRLLQLINAIAMNQNTIKGFSEELLLQYNAEQDDFIGDALQMLREEARNVQK